jgi:hypothetical protein
MKKVMNAKMPSACPRGPQRRAYTPQKITASQVASRSVGIACSVVARASTGKPTTGSRAVVTAWPRTVGSPTVNSASSAARPPVIEAGSESPASSDAVTARPMPSTARSETRSRARPGSGAMNIFFTVGSPPPLRVDPTFRTAFRTWEWRHGSGSGFLAVRRFAAPCIPTR